MPLSDFNFKTIRNNCLTEISSRIVFLKRALFIVIAGHCHLFIITLFINLSLFIELSLFTCLSLIHCHCAIFKIASVLVDVLTSRVIGSFGPVKLCDGLYLRLFHRCYPVHRLLKQGPLLSIEIIHTFYYRLDVINHTTCSHSDYSITQSIEFTNQDIILITILQC